MVKITPSDQNGLTKVSAADCFQIRSVSVDRFIASIGNVEQVIIAQIQEAVYKIVGVT